MPVDRNDYTDFLIAIFLYLSLIHILCAGSHRRGRKAGAQGGYVHQTDHQAPSGGDVYKRQHMSC